LPRLRPRHDPVEVLTDHAGLACRGETRQYRKSL
jgi:hypothetical protein